MRTTALLLSLILAIPAAELPPAVPATGLPSATPANDFVNDPVFQLVFFAVLEGCYRDGVSTEAVDLILPRRPDGGPIVEHNFVYSCPLCMPTIEALHLYRARPTLIDKKRRSTFGPGLPAAVLAQLADPVRKVRMPALQALIDGWVQARLDAQHLDAAARQAWTVALADRRKRGGEALERLRTGKHGDAFIDQYADWPKACAVCDGAAHGGGVLMPAPR